MIKLIIYEDNLQFREGMSMLINGSEGFEMLASFKNCDYIEEDLVKYQPDVILMDIDMPGTDGIEGLKRVRAVNDTVKVLMLTVFDDNQRIFDSIKNGANGYVLKKTPPARLLEYIQEANTGGAPMTGSIATQVLKMLSGGAADRSEEFNLSERERTVLQLLVKGYSYKMIAGEIFISIDTVRSHIKKIYEKLQVNSKSEAVAKAFKGRIV
jgi:DNA-binding NarL/FixJ family response regulator